MKKEKRSLFNIIFGKKIQQSVGNYLQLMSGFNPVYTDIRRRHLPKQYCKRMY